MYDLNKVVEEIERTHKTTFCVTKENGTAVINLKVEGDKINVETTKVVHNYNNDDTVLKGLMLMELGILDGSELT